MPLESIDAPLYSGIGWDIVYEYNPPCSQVHTQTTPNSTGRCSVDAPLLGSGYGGAAKGCLMLLLWLGVFCTDQVFYQPRKIFLVLLRYIKLVLCPRPRQDPSYKYSNSLSKEKLSQVTIGAKTQGRARRDGWERFFIKKSVGLLLFEVW